VRLSLTAALLLALVLPGHAQAPAAQAASASHKTAWYFYKVKCGYQDEFQTLFARNHLPVLREEIKTGRIVSVKTYVPSYHGDGRSDWTFAVEIVFKDAAALVGPRTKPPSSAGSFRTSPAFSRRRSAASKSWRRTGMCR
jgi:hypothetical protein